MSVTLLGQIINHTNRHRLTNIHCTCRVFYSTPQLPSEVLNASMVVPINLGNVVCRISGGVVRGCDQGPLIPEISEDSCRNALREFRNN